jgi:PAS domain S-box-containing protein
MLNKLRARQLELEKEIEELRRSQNQLEALRESEQRLRLITDNVPAVIGYVSARDLRYEYVNRTYADLFGLSPEQIIGRQANEIMDADAYERALPNIYRAREGESVSFENILTIQGNQRLFSIRYVPKFNTEGSVQNIIVMAVDITDRNQVEAQQRIAEAKATRQIKARYRHVFELATEGIFQSTLEGRIIEVNPALAHMMGYKSPEEFKSSITDVAQQLYVNPATRKAWLRQLEKNSIVQGFEAELKRKDGSHMWVTMSARLIRDTYDGVVIIEGTNQDITEHKRLEKAILEVRDYERRLIGHDIHEGLCQQLFSIALNCTMLREDLKVQFRKESEAAAKILDQIDAAVTEARNLARGYSIANLERGGLATALRELASSTSSAFRIPCLYEHADSICVTNPTTANHLYRIAREAVHNAIKHGQPNRIVIRTMLTSDGGRLSIIDDGIGMPEGKTFASGMGLDTMRYRSSVIGGTLTIQRAPSGGTIITCEFPDDST